MAAFTSLGVGSGLDLNTIVTQLVALERRPLQTMQSQAASLNNKVSLYGRINSLFSGLKDASNKLTDTSLWQKTAVTTSDASAVAVSSSNGAAVGNYSITVGNLAANQTVASGSALGASSDLVGSGTLRLQLGSWSGAPPAFATKSGSSEYEISVDNTDTLATLRDKINAAGAGVTASLVTDASGVRLALRSVDSGVENGFRLAVTDGDGLANDNAGLSRFAYDPPDSTVGMVVKQAADNARATINGIPVESAGNDITGAVDGLTLSLRKESATAVNVAVSRDRDAIVAGIKSFADAYNALVGYISEQTKYDAGSKTGGPLQGEGAATSMQTQLRNVLNTASGASATFARMSDVGLEVQRNGTLSVNQTKLDAAAGNLVELKKAFASSDGVVAANNGFARRYATLASDVLGIGGPLTARTDGLRKLLTKNGDDQTRLNDRVDQFQQRLVAQYTAMDANVAKLNALSSYVTQQIAQMNRSTT